MLYSKKLYIKKDNGATESISLYTDKADIPDGNCLDINDIDANKIVYAALGDAVGVNSASLRVLKGSKTYAAMKDCVIIDSYAITGTITEQDDYIDVSSDGSPENDHYDYNGYLNLTFSGITQFPVKYISYSGDEIGLLADSFKKQTDGTYLYTDHITGKHYTVDDKPTFDSVVPKTGVDGYSKIQSCTITGFKPKTGT